MAVSDDIKARIDIVDLVSQYVPDLKRSGRNFTARCPFHQENTPSFVVFPDRQTWRCFGACAVGGDAFSFVMKAEGLDFPAALRKLAERAGVPLPEHQRPDSPRNPIFAVNEAALRFFRDALVAERGSLARAYVEQRGLSEEAVVRWGIGYAPSTGDELLRRLLAMGFAEEALVAAGVATRSEQGNVRDMFRGRLIFTLRDADGQTIGFAGRSLDGSNPKYLNTPQTGVFDKGRLLYGMDRAKEAIGREGVAVVVEGYMDVITAHEHGYTNVVASMGTALTEHQVALLKGRAPRIVLALDADAAGQEATLRSLHTSWELMGSEIGRTRSPVLRRGGDLDVLRIAVLSQGKDPDELIRSDPALWRRTVDEAVPVVDFLLTAEARRVDISTPEGKAAVAEALMPIIFAVPPEGGEQERYLSKLSGLLGVSPAALQAAFGRMRWKLRAGPHRGGPQLRPSSAARENESMTESVFKYAERDPLDEYALVLATHYPDLMERIAEIPLEHLRRSENRAVLSALAQAGTIEGAYSQLDGPFAEHMDRLVSSVLPQADRKERGADWEACLRRLEERHLRDLKAQEEVALAQESAPGDGQTPSIEYREAVHRQALVTNERLKQLFVSGTGAPVNRGES